MAEDQVQGGGEGDAWIAALQQELNSASETLFSDWSLYQLPLKLRFRSPSEDLYTPWAVSIGPLHHGDARFSVMEKQKLRYMASFLRRNRAETPGNSLINCAQKILNIESQALECYSDILSPQSSGNLAKILLVDGCFILELFIRSYKVDVAQGRPGMLTHPIFQHDIDANDPLLNLTWTQFVLRLDLALLQNQIPFFILEDLFRIIAGHDYERLTNDFLATMAFSFFKPLLQNASLWSAPVSRLGEPRTHLLHLLLNTYQQSEEQVPETVGTIVNLDYICTLLPINKLIPSASELRDNGMAFEMAPKRNLIDIKFSNGTFEIPPLHLTKSTEMFLSNLMAFECCLKNHQQNIASYVFLMSQLVQTTEDVTLLEAQGIIVNGLANGVGVHLMFHRLVTQHMPSKFSFRTLCDEANADFERRQSFQEKLKRGYLRTRWGNISFMVLHLLFVFFTLGVLAAAVFQDFQPPSDIIISLLIAYYAYEKIIKQLRTTHLQFT